MIGLFVRALLNSDDLNRTKDKLISVENKRHDYMKGRIEDDYKDAVFIRKALEMPTTTKSHALAVAMLSDYGDEYEENESENRLIEEYIMRKSPLVLSLEAQVAEMKGGACS